MKKNVGKKDAIIRYGIAIVSLVGAILLPSLRTPLLIFAAVMAITAFVGLCGIYKLIGVNTCPIDQKM